MFGKEDKIMYLNGYNKYYNRKRERRVHKTPKSYLDEFIKKNHWKYKDYIKELM